MTDAEPRNELLLSLRASELAVLRPYLERFPLVADSVLYRVDDRVRWVYFVESGVAAVIVGMLSGDSIATSLVGPEGAVGLVEALGTETMTSSVVVQLAGEALRVKTIHIQALFNASPALRRAVGRYVDLLQAESRQALACNTMHMIGHRLNRWLLECQDRARGQRVLPLTQEHLGQILGVSRASVSRAATAALERGWIRYSRGAIEIVDRQGLESDACECLEIGRRLHGRLSSPGGVRRHTTAPSDDPLAGNALRRRRAGI